MSKVSGVMCQKYRWYQVNTKQW